jgi:uncharacterized membrane protein SpoIIM required for sporulation
MNVERLVAERQGAWMSLEELVRRAGRRPERLPPGQIIELARAYRAAAADLALARRSCAPTDPVLVRLEELVRRSRGLVYDHEPRRGSVVAFFSREYWRRIAERPAFLVVSTGGLVVTGVLGAIWAYADEAAARGFVPAAFAPALDTPVRDVMPADQAAALSSTIFVNNIRVTLLAFAAGLLVCLGTAFVIVNNGALLGVVAGLVSSAGMGRDFVVFVVPHGVLELTCIVVAGAAGLRLGWAIVDPGPSSRAKALIAEARSGVEIVLGTMPWLVLAGIVEGIVAPRLGFGSALVVGLGLGGAWWALLLWRGRSPPTTAPTPGYSRARALALR